MEVEHGILFLSDSGPDFEIPENTGAAFATLTKDCVCFWVLSSTDGEATIVLGDTDCEMEERRLFSGKIAAPSGTLTLSSSDGFNHLSMAVKPGMVSIDIWAENDRNPDWVWIKVATL